MTQQRKRKTVNVTGCGFNSYLEMKYLICSFLRGSFFAVSRGAAAQSVTVKPTDCGFDPHSRRRSGVEDERNVEFCHSTRNASRIRQKVGNGVS